MLELFVFLMLFVCLVLVIWVQFEAYGDMGGIFILIIWTIFLHSFIGVGAYLLGSR